ncbi:MAG TPA: hypothetical protein VML55_20125 [Planctomycetaceae bacterium]|nr:hypothetical protein [Planctomycetaceae bacterium]
MFRENVLTQDEIIDRIGSTMVPVALDYQTIRDPASRESRFLRPLMKQRKQEQGLWILTPEGQVLGGFAGFGDMVGQTKKVIEDALEAFGPLEPRRAKAAPIQPYRGRGVSPDGSVCLAECIRTSDDALGFVNARSPVISSVTLSDRAFRAFAPRRAVVGAKWTLPEDVAKQLARTSSPMCYQHAPQPDWVTDVRIAAVVRRVDEGVARLSYEGRIASSHRVGRTTVSVQETELTGEGVYDLKTGTMQSVLLIGSGRLRWPEAPEKVVTFDALVEWDLEATESSSQAER